MGERITKTIYIYMYNKIVASYIIPKKDISIWEKELLLISEKYKIYSFSHADRVLKNITNKKKERATFCLRLKAAYYSTYNVHWNHK